MLDPKFIRESIDLVREGLNKRKEDIDLDKFLLLDKKRREYIAQTEQLKSRRNAVTQDIAKLKRETGCRSSNKGDAGGIRDHQGNGRQGKRSPERTG
jgi:seryl-tRNA synthetase